MTDHVKMIAPVLPQTIDRNVMIEVLDRLGINANRCQSVTLTGDGAEVEVYLYIKGELGIAARPLAGGGRYATTTITIPFEDDTDGIPHTITD